MEPFLKTVSALNDPTRVMILAFLDHYGESCVCELESSLHMGQSRLSRHLKILKEAGFLSVSRKGTWAYYALDIRGDFQAHALASIRTMALELPRKVSACPTHTITKESA